MRAVGMRNKECSLILAGGGPLLLGVDLEDYSSKLLRKAISGDLFSAEDENQLDNIDVLTMRTLTGRPLYLDLFALDKLPDKSFNKIIFDQESHQRKGSEGPYDCPIYFNEPPINQLCFVLNDKNKTATPVSLLGFLQWLDMRDKSKLPLMGVHNVTADWVVLYVDLPQSIKDQLSDKKLTPNELHKHISLLPGFEDWRQSPRECLANYPVDPLQRILGCGGDDRELDDHELSDQDIECLFKAKKILLAENGLEEKQMAVQRCWDVMSQCERRNENTEQLSSIISRVESLNAPEAQVAMLLACHTFVARATQARQSHLPLEYIIFEYALHINAAQEIPKEMYDLTMLRKPCPGKNTSTNEHWLLLTAIQSGRLSTVLEEELYSGDLLNSQCQGKREGWTIRHWLLIEAIQSGKLSMVPEELYCEDFLNNQWPGKREGTTNRHWLLIRVVQSGKLQGLPAALYSENFLIGQWPGKPGGWTIRHWLLIRVVQSGKLQGLPAALYCENFLIGQWPGKPGGWTIRHWLLNEAIQSGKLSMALEELYCEDFLNDQWPGKREGATNRHWLLIKALQSGELQDLPAALYVEDFLNDQGSGQQEVFTILRRLLVEAIKSGRLRMVPEALYNENFLHANDGSVYYEKYSLYTFIIAFWIYWVTITGANLPPQLACLPAMLFGVTSYVLSDSPQNPLFRCCVESNCNWIIKKLALNELKGYEALAGSLRVVTVAGLAWMQCYMDVIRVSEVDIVKDHLPYPIYCILVLIFQIICLDTVCNMVNTWELDCGRKVIEANDKVPLKFKERLRTSEVKPRSAWFGLWRVRTENTEAGYDGPKLKKQ